MKFNVQLNIQPVILRMLALGLASLMTILAISGIRAIARVDQGSSSSSPVVSSVAIESPANSTLTEWSADTPAQSSPAQSSPASAATPASASPAPGVTAPPLANGSPVPAPAFPSVVSSGYEPGQEVAFADSSNYGDRYATDIYGNPVNNDWLIVLHETVGSADSAIQMFQTRHPSEDDQVSYHTLIRRNGTVVYIVPPEKRAYGAGNSVFNGANGAEAVRTDPNFPPSVNNFAYHISLETPPDGYNNNPTHSGYSSEQYQSLAWLIARTPVPDDRITTHRAIDQSSSRMDPRSFNVTQFFTYLHAYPNRSAIATN